MAVLARYLEKFESLDGSITYTWPTDNYEWETQQDISTAFAKAVGANGVLDLLGYGEAPLGAAIEAVRFSLNHSDHAIDTVLDEMFADLHRSALGKLYTYDGSTRRWAYARLLEMPKIKVANRFIVYPTLRFTRTSPWFGTTQVTGTQVCDNDPESFNLTNAGNFPVYWMELRFRANSSSGFTNPNLINDTNGYEFSSTFDAASVNHELKVDTQEGTVLQSTDNGVNYVDGWVNFTIPDTQHGFMVLEPGVNAMRYLDGGTPNLNLDYAYYPAYYR